MLPFTTDIYFAAIAQYNLAIWPFPLLGGVLALAALALAIRPLAGGPRLVGVILCVGWLWSGIGFHLLHFAQINFAAPAYAGLFVLQGLLIGWLCVVRGALSFRFTASFTSMAALILAVLAVMTWPLTGLLMGDGLAAAPVFAADPTATVLLTLTLWLLARGPALLWLAVIPVLWTFVDGATYLALGEPVGLVFPVLGLVVVTLLVLKRRADRPNGSEGE